MQIFYLFEGTLKTCDSTELSTIKYDKIWIDMTAMSKEENELVEKHFSLHPVTSEDLYNNHVRVKVEEFENYIFCVFYSIKRNGEFELIETDYILGKNFLITNHPESLKHFEELKREQTRIKKLMDKGMDFLFHRLLDHEIDNYFPELEFLDDAIEELEEEATERTNPKVCNSILAMKRNLVQIKKVTLPQREKIGFLTKNEYKFISKKSIPYFRDVYDHAIRVSDSIENYRESVGNAYEAYMSTVSNNMNQVMKVLSIITTIALPITAVSGIYGTNFSVLPGSSSPFGFWLMILIMLIMSISMIAFFKRQKWF